MSNFVEKINGGLSVDDRGSVSYINDFNFNGVKRSYMVENHSVGFIRAWHGHNKEGKYVWVVSGSALVQAIPMSSLDIGVNVGLERHVLSAKTPSVLWIPSGFANGFKTLEKDTKIMFFSTSTLEDSLGDDTRYAYDVLDNAWDIEYR